MTMSVNRRRGIAGRAASWTALLALALLPLLLAGQPASAAGKARNSCVDCHSDAKFLVQNKKLYDYFQAWKDSIHSQANVTCVDCHGGNPQAATKEAAHGGRSMSASEQASPTSYQNIPTTCARCHKTVYQRFKESAHYEHLRATAQEEQGPNCVTCHGSVNTTVLNVNTVRETCRQCHNEQTKNNPEIPSEAEAVLSNFLSIHRYYRYIVLRAKPEQVKSFVTIMEPLVKRVAADWHTFDLDKVKEDTHNLVVFLKEQRDKLNPPPAAGGQKP
jgi:hypothetical protein